MFVASRRAFTLVELLIVIGIIVILIALLLPAIGMVRASSRASQCASRLRQVGMAITSAREKLGAQFRIRDWQTKVKPFLQDTDAVLDCPANVPPDGSSSYGINHRALRMGGQDAGKIVGLDYKQPLVTVVANSLAGQDAWPSTRAPRHTGYLNVLFFDGRVEAKDPDVIDPRYCLPFSTYWRPKVDEHLFTLSDCPNRPQDGAGTDTDGDGDPNSTDPDDDGDGIPDDADPDDDNDGIPDASDPDDDNDGVPDDSDPDTDGGGSDGGTGSGGDGSCPEGDCGLLATYYTGGNWGGTSAQRIDPTIHLPFGSVFFDLGYWDIPLPGSNTSGWDTGSFGSGTWFGFIKPEHTEVYTFYVACDNEVWVYVDGNEIIHRSGGGSAWVQQYDTTIPGTLTAGEWVIIEVRLKEHTPGLSPSHVSVKWESPSTPLSDIPPCNLCISN